MKIQLLIILCSVYFSVNGQVRNQNEIRCVIDSLILDNTEKKVSWYGDVFGRYSHGNIIEANVMDSLTILDYKQEEWLMMYLKGYIESEGSFYQKSTAYELLFSLGKYSNIKENRMSIVEVLLGSARIPYNVATLKNIIYEYHKDDFSEKSLEMIKKLAFENLSEEDVNVYKKYIVKAYNLSAWADDKVVKIIRKSNRNQNDYDFIKDSLIKERVNLNISSFQKNCPLPSIIEAIGYFGLEDCIPKLQRLEGDPCLKELESEYEYTMAKLNVLKYKEEIFKRKVFNFKFFQTEEALFQYLANNDLSESKGKFVSYIDKETGKKVEESQLYYSIYWMQDYILNFPEDLKLPKFIEILDEQKAKLGYDWLLENKEKLILDTNSFHKYNLPKAYHL